MAWSPVGDLVAVADRTDRGVSRVFDAGRGRVVAELRSHSRPLVSAAFAADGHHVLTASKDGTARLHDCSVRVPLDRLVTLAART